MSNALWLLGNNLIKIFFSQLNDFLENSNQNNIQNNYRGHNNNHLTQINEVGELNTGEPDRMTPAKLNVSEFSKSSSWSKLGRQVHLRDASMTQKNLKLSIKPLSRNESQKYLWKDGPTSSVTDNNHKMFLSQSVNFDPQGLNENM